MKKVWMGILAALLFCNLFCNFAYAQENEDMMQGGGGPKKGRPMMGGMGPTLIATSDGGVVDVTQGELRFETGSDGKRLSDFCLAVLFDQRQKFSDYFKIVRLIAKMKMGSSLDI